MVQQNRKFSKEFKEEAVRLSYGTEKTITQVAVELGIAPTLLFAWRQKVIKYGEAAFPGPGNERDTELRKLQIENKHLKLEIEILKKAAKFMAPKNR